MSRDPVSQVPVLWITGLSGVGKSTLARALHAALDEAPLLLDGDALRRQLDTPAGRGYDLESRRTLAWHIAHLAHAAALRAQPVIVATISLFHDVQRWNRRRNARFAEIVLTAPIETLRLRHPALYAEGAREVWGVDLVPEFPSHPELTLVQEFNAGSHAAQLAQAQRLWQRLASA